MCQAMMSLDMKTFMCLEDVGGYHTDQRISSNVLVPKIVTCSPS